MKKEKTNNELQQEVLELRKENKGLQETVTTLLAEIERLRNIDRSLVTTGSDLPVLFEGLTPEQEIVETQIHMLNVASRQKQLSLEETRTLDLLIKNKKLLDVKEEKDAEPDYEDLSDDDLMELAGNVSIKETEIDERAEDSSEETVG